MLLNDTHWLQKSIVPGLFQNEVGLYMKVDKADKAKNDFKTIIDQFPVLSGHLNIISHSAIDSVFKINKSSWIDLFATLKSTLSGIRSNNPFNLRQSYRNMLQDPINATSELLIRRALGSSIINPFNTDSFSMFINEGEFSGKLNQNFHLHFIPRNKDDLRESAGGLRRMFLHDNLPSREVSELLSGQGIKSLRNLLLIKYHNYWYSRLETSPCAPGHLQIVLKRNIFSLKDLTLAEWLEIHSILMNAPDFIRTINLEKSYERALDEYYGLTHPALLIKALHNISKIKTTDSYTIAVNYGATAGSEAGQLVLDIIPRYKGDVPEPKGGFRKMFFE